MKILLADNRKRSGRKPAVDIFSLPDTDTCIDHGTKGTPEGYSHRGKDRLHRLVFKHCNGWLPEVVMHSCDNPRCINPKHLLPGTKAGNNKDRAAKGRSAKSVPSRRKITIEQAIVIRERYSPTRCSLNGVSALARDFCVDVNTIYNIVEFRTHTE